MPATHASEPASVTSAPASSPENSSPEATYRQLRQVHQSKHHTLVRNGTRALQLLAASLAAFLLLALFHGVGLLSVAPFLLILVLFVVLIGRYLRLQAGIETQLRLLALYDTGLHRLDGSQTQSGLTGPTPEPGHLFARDLDLLGPDSLFGLLATVRTTLGEIGLSRYLLQAASYEETLLRQQAVRELAPNTQLRERIALLGASPIQRISAQLLDDWLLTPAPVFHPVVRPILVVTACVSAFLLRGLFAPHPSSTLLANLALVLAVQAFICFRLRAKIQPILATSVRLDRSIRLLTEAIALLDELSFDSPRLRQLQQLARQPGVAVKELRRLQSQLTIVDQRGQPYFLPLSLLLAAGTQAAISLARWKQEHAEHLRIWLDAWAEFEALNAVANYAFEHPDNAWPILLPPEHPPLYEATRLGHPLLAGSVTNDLTLGDSTAFYLISGSNMAGKSTLLRSIGVSAVLAYAGAPVRAQSLRLTPLALGASLALTDSLAEGRSKFLAEVERLSAIAHLSANAPVLFLVDEIFSGTNSADRLTAADAVLRRLLANGAIGALSTHDLALTGLATGSNRGLNVHMASPDAADPLAFDFKLKPGVNTTSNALAIIRLLGL